MKISEIMTPEVELVAPDTKLSEIARKMRDDDVGSIPVAENDRLVGMVTDRDLVIRGLAQGRDPANMSAREVMSNPIYYCYDDQTIEEVLDNMGDVHVRRLAVIDRDKHLVGIVSLGDLSRAGPVQQAGEAMKSIAESPPN
jgi:CBS domain-containing protein